MSDTIQECRHGSLRRSCAICERDDEIERLERELDKKDERIEELEQGVRPAVEWFGYEFRQRIKSVIREALEEHERDKRRDR